MTKEEIKELKALTEELRNTVNNEIFKNASNFEILKALLQCAIINSQKNKEA